MFWDYGMRWVCETMQRTYVRGHRIDGCVPLQAVTGETVDISEYLDFGFYDRIWYHDNAGLGEVLPGRWLGVSKNVGGQMCYYVLARSGSCFKVIGVAHHEFRATSGDHESNF